MSQQYMEKILPESCNANMYGRANIATYCVDGKIMKITGFTDKDCNYACVF